MKIKLLPPTAQRVPYHTSDKINRQIRKQTISRIDTYRKENEKILDEKIKQLNSEWDTERVLETNAASVMLAGSVMGFQKSKSPWFLLTGTVSLFLLQHAIQGWCPPVPIMRQMGIRTAEEISNEKTVYKYLRGDFVPYTNKADQMLTMAEKQ